MKQYFDKIEAAENPPQPQPRTQKVDTEAATRMIKAGLVCYARARIKFITNFEKVANDGSNSRMIKH